MFPSTEAALPQARSGPFAGCISATANLNADLCARAYRSGDAAALAEAVAIRKLFDGKPLVPASRRCSPISTAIRNGRAWRRRCRRLPPPTVRPSVAGYEAVRAKRVA